MIAAAPPGRPGARVAIMQPYLFPYLGYFQLIAASEVFVLYDDVHYIKQGWINRNSIVGTNGPERFTLQVIGASSNRNINEVRVGANRARLARTIGQRYSRAPEYPRVWPVIERILALDEGNLARFVEASLRELCACMGITTRFEVSSRLSRRGEGLRGEARVIEIASGLGASNYINPIGGTALYDAASFRAAGITLQFLRMRQIEYPQFDGPFQPNLSCIDVLMFNPAERVRELLLECDRVAA
jgi:hypothetical protein